MKLLFVISNVSLMAAVSLSFNIDSVFKGFSQGNFGSIDIGPFVPNEIPFTIESTHQNMQKQSPLATCTGSSHVQLLSSGVRCALGLLNFYRGHAGSCCPNTLCVFYQSNIC